MEVYVDDMLTKSITAEKHSEDLKETFDVLRRYKMKLNPSKCVFGVPSGKFLGFQVHQEELRYTPKAAIKGQAVSDFIAEFTEPDAEVRRMMEDEQASGFQWKLHVDGSSNTHGSGAGIVITTSEGDTMECAMRFDFKATNNQAEYEALLAGLRVCIALGADKLEIYSDSQVWLTRYWMNTRRGMST
ncbi:hypothetical protein LWI29_015620 [Acer saccharum]|uniref:RNase H type-1 domain-containing protein n=1 Tax=Acer saccharum TaxID=4024 RepID=A0AA39VR94_ACESA|nr:hypothetical protein LWI29_015620 [Acer saccharum]